MTAPSSSNTSVIDTPSDQLVSADRIGGAPRGGRGAEAVPPARPGQAPIIATTVIATMSSLEAAGYRGWYVLEQDAGLGPVAPDDRAGPLADVRAGVDYVRSLRLRSLRQTAHSKP
ncbi:MAG: hypothetical protein ACRD0G_16145 [Acidimicrobiales bacterium]